MFETALVALDLAPAEEPIVDCLPDLQRWGVKRVELAHVLRIGYLQGGALSHQQDYIDWLERTAQPLGAAGFEVSVSVRASGVPAEEILALAAAQNAGLVVIGSRGHNVVSRLFLGSVARDNASMIIVGKFGRGRVASMLIGSTASDLCERSGRPVLMVP